MKTDGPGATHGEDMEQTGHINQASQTKPSVQGECRNEIGGRRWLTTRLKLALDAIEERERLPRSSNDMLDAFISIHDKRPDGFTRRDMIAASYISL